MSIRTNPIKAVPLLLRRLETIEKRAYNLDDLKSELVNVKELFTIMKKIEEEVLDTLTMVDGYLRNFNLPKLMEEKEDICKRIRNSTQKLLPAATSQRVESSSGQAFQDVEPDNRENVHGTPFPILDQEVENFIVHYNSLDPRSKSSFLSFLAFPENAVIKKMHTIFWWLLEDPFAFDLEKEVDEKFDYLQSHKLIVPHGNSRFPVVNKFKMNPCIHHELVRPILQKDIDTYNYIKNSYLVLDQQKVKLSDEVGSKYGPWVVLNASASYLDVGSQWMAKRKNLFMLHLGRFQVSSSHHIEVKSEEFLKELRDQNLEYLCLRGISRIFELPPSIVQNQKLKVLDLKACHNLEKLPDDISSLRQLKHLDVSQCYLLERMPKGIEKLTKLKVLKGFVIGSSSKTPCRISDLANLKKLERLSIHIGNEAVIQDKEFESLKELSALKQLKISWGVSDTRYNNIQIIFPSSLEKLRLEGFPEEKIPKWLKPSVLPLKLKVLYIEGGNLKSMDPGEDNKYVNVEIMRLKYLKYLKVNKTKLKELFPSLVYVQIKQLNCPLVEWEY